MKKLSSISFSVIVVSIVSSLGCSNVGDTGGTGAGGATSSTTTSTSTSSNSGGGTSTSSNSGGGKACDEGATRSCVGPAGCHGGQECDSSGKWGSCDCGNPSTTTSSSSSSGSGAGPSSSTGTSSGTSSGAGGGSDACVQRTAWPHYRPGTTSANLLAGTEMVRFHWWLTNRNVEDYCWAYIQDASMPDSDKDYTCLAKFCEGDGVVFSVEMTGGADAFAFDVCDDPGKWCSGKGDNCAKVVGASNASVWWSADDPKFAAFWARDNGSNNGTMTDNNDGLACTNNGTFTMPSN